jgi:hypothetical protein
VAPAPCRPARHARGDLPADELGQSARHAVGAARGNAWRRPGWDVGTGPPVEGDGRREGAVDRTNLLAALARVPRHGGRPGMDGRTEAERPGDRPWRRTFVGLRCPARRPNRRPVRAKARKACQPASRRLAPRTRGVAWPPRGAGGRAVRQGGGGVRWPGRSDGRLAGTGCLDATPPAGRPLAALGATARSGTPEPWRQPRPGLAHGAVRARAVAAPPPSGADLGGPWSVCRRAWCAPLVAAPSSLTPSAEPPAT